MTFLLFALGALLRIGLWAFSRSLFCDEVASIDCSSGSFMNTLLFYVNDAHPPLYFLLLDASMKVFGFLEWAFRLPSLFSGLLTLWAVYLFTREMFGRKTGLLALFLTAISPFALHMSAEVRNHGFAMPFTALASFFLLKAVRAPEKKRWGWAYVAAAWTAVGTTHFAWLWVAGVLMIHAILVLRKSVLPATLKYQAVFLLAAAPFAGILFGQAGREAMMSYAGNRDLFNVIWYFVNGVIIPVAFMSKREVLSFAANSPVFLFFISAFALAGTAMFSAVVRDTARRSFSSLILAGLLLIPMLFIDWFSTERFYARYFAFLFFIHAALLAHGLSSLKPKLLKILSIALISLAGLVSSAVILAYPGDAYERSHFSVFVDYLGRHGKKTDLVFCDLGMTRMHMKLEKIFTEATVMDEGSFDAGILDHYEAVWATQTLLHAPGVRETLREKGFSPLGPRLFFEHSIILSVFSKQVRPEAELPPIMNVPIPWRHGMKWFAPMGKEILNITPYYDWDK